jgi:hypothetical protein
VLLSAIFAACWIVKPVFLYPVCYRLSGNLSALDSKLANGENTMDNTLDIVILKFLKALGFGVILAGVFVATTAQADYRPYNYLETYGFDMELQHCVELLRPSLGAVENEKVKYVVEDITLRGPWYRFEITATVIGVDGSTRVDGFKVLCKSNRWIQSAKLIERRNDPAVNRNLVVKNSSELVAYIVMATNTSQDE